MATSKTVVVEFEDRDEKKNVVKFTSDSDAVGSIYVSKAAVKKLGDPAGVKVTIEPA